MIVRGMEGWAKQYHNFLVGLDFLLDVIDINFHVQQDLCDTKSPISSDDVLNRAMYPSASVRRSLLHAWF